MIRNANWTGRCLSVLLFLSFGTLVFAAPQIASDQKARIHGTITARSGELVQVTDKKSHTAATVVVNENTKIERKKSKHLFFGHQDMDVTALVPGLPIEAEGIGNAKGQLIAKTISFVPDIFSIEVAEEKQILANQTAAANAQKTAAEGVQQAQAAQTSATQASTSAGQAEASANAAGQTAAEAGELAAFDLGDIALVNRRVSDLDDYKVLGEAGIYFEAGKADLDAAAKLDLDTLAALIKGVGLDGYMIEIAGYASSEGSRQGNQKLSADRAAAVAQYLMEQQNIPMRRILAPAGYGATHPDAPNTDPQGRALNRRVDVKVLVNRALGAAS